MTPIWYVLQVAPQRERLVEGEIRRGLGLLAYVPYERFSVRRASRSIEVVRPLMPGYVFCGTKSGGMPWSDISATRHVRDWLTVDDDVPAPVSDLEIMQIQRLAEAHNSRKIGQRSLQPGDRVKVADGPFASMTALIATVRGNTAGIVIPMLGGPREVQIPAAHLERVA